VLLPKSVIVGYGRHSETAQVLVNNEGLTNLSLLKIQSFPLGNLGGVEFMRFKIIKIIKNYLTA
jgi:hypothetical protein